MIFLRAETRGKPVKRKQGYEANNEKSGLIRYALVRLILSTRWGFRGVTVAQLAFAELNGLQLYCSEKLYENGDYGLDSDPGAMSKG